MDLEEYIIAALITKGIAKECSIDVSNDAQTVSRILEESRRVLYLSKSTRKGQIPVDLPFISSFNGIPIHFEMIMNMSNVHQVVLQYVLRKIL